MVYNTLSVTDHMFDTTVYDDSIVSVTESALPKRLTILQPIFASKGKANVILDYDKSSEVKSMFGDDIEDLEEYGQGGLNLIHAMQNGASAQVCRLLPDDATTAYMNVYMTITKSSSVPVYERDDDGALVYDDEGKKIPVYTDDTKTTQKVTDGYTVKISMVGGSTAKSTSKVVTSVAYGEDSITVPLFTLTYNGAGKCGNNIGFTIDNDLERDAKVDDGRRYIMKFYELDDTGSVSEIDDMEFHFALNPSAVILTGSSVLENLQYQFADKDSSGNERQVKCKPYIMQSYTKLQKWMGIDITDIDFLGLVNADGIEYESYVATSDSYTIGTSTIRFLTGGSDGSLQEGLTLNGTTFTADTVEATKKSLLKNFFEGKIDKRIYTEYIINSDIVLDANYDYDVVKPAMLGKFHTIRPDVMILADIGTGISSCANAIPLIKQVLNMTSRSDGYTVAVMAQSGMTTDRDLNVEVTGVYDYSALLAKNYGANGTFTICCGYNTGRVNTMEFDWLPYKDEKDTMIGPLEKVGCIYAMEFPNKKICYAAETTAYNQDHSVLTSFRNGMVIGDSIRFAKDVLAKHSFAETANESIADATDEFSERLPGRYPDSITCSPNLYQTERDKLLDQATCELTYYFPSVAKKWSIKIYSKRQSA